MQPSKLLRPLPALLLMLGAIFPALAAGPRGTDLNLANQAELEMVKGIGPQLSERILDERSRGRFSSWQDFIARMKGIGPSQASRLSAAGLRIGGEGYVGTGDALPAPAK
jgi:competence protein ComEA